MLYGACGIGEYRRQPLSDTSSAIYNTGKWILDFPVTPTRSCEL
jgi:hypothetical protein